MAMILSVIVEVADCDQRPGRIHYYMDIYYILFGLSM